MSELRKIKLGNTGLEATMPSMGCLPVQRCSVEEGVSLLRSAYDGGIRFFDTANAYTDSEKKIGLALSDVRKDIVIATKSGAHEYDGILAHIENSLKMLKTDYIDLFQFHMLNFIPDANDPKGIYAAALEAKRRGWIRHIGFTAHQIGIAEQLIDSGLYETCQFPFSYISADRDIALAERCKKAGMGFIAMKGLAGGLLTNVRACQAFMNQHDNVVPIWGIQHPEELKQWLDIAKENPSMDDETADFIAKERKELAGSFCRGCGYCLPCTVGIEINNAARMNMLLRRSPWQPYMSDEWYAKMQKINDCVDCRVCTTRCPYGLDTPALLKYMLKDYNEFYESHKGLL